MPSHPRIVPYLLAGVLSLLFALSLQGQGTGVVFRQLLGPSESGYVLRAGITVDSSGFTWLAGINRIIRHDGRNARDFPLPAKDVDPRRSCYVFGLVAGPDGTIWGSSRTGVVRLRPGDRNLRFVFPRGEDRPSPGSELGGPVMDLALDAQGRAWFVSGASLFRCAPEATEPEPIPWPQADLSDRERRMPVAVEAGRDDTIWICFRSGAVIRLEVETLAARVLRPGSFASAPASLGPITAFRTTGVDQALMATGSGLFEVDFGRGSWQELRAEEPEIAFVDQARARDLVIGVDGQLWVGTYGEGIVRLDRRSGRASRYRHDPTRPGSLPSDRIRSLCLDGSGALWVGTARGYALLESTEPFALQPYSVALSDAALLSRPAIIVDAEERLWVARHDCALEIVDLDSGQGRVIEEAKSCFESLPSVISIAADDDGGVWVGVREQGLLQLDEQARMRRQLLSSGSGPRSDNVMGICLDEDGRLIMTHDLGFDRYDPTSGRIEALTGFEPRGPDCMTQRYFASDRRGGIWASSFNDQLLEIPRGQGRVVVHALRRPHADDPLPAQVRGLAVGPAGGVFIAALNGLFRCDVGTGLTTLVPATRQESVSGALGIVVDQGGDLWVPTPWNGLLRYDPHEARLRSHRPDAVFGALEFLPGICGRARDGRIFFGTERGVLHFRPEEIPAPPAPAQPQFTSVKVMGVELLSRGAKGPIRVADNDQVVSVAFVSPRAGPGDVLSYRYRLVGSQDHWIALGDHQGIDFAHLPLGRLLLEVVAVSNASGQVSPPSRLELRVELPFWRQPLVRALAVAAVLCAVILLIYLRLKRVGRQAQALRREIERRERSESERRVLEEQLMHVMKLEAVGSLAGGVAHDFNNILTAVLGHVDLMRGALREGVERPKLLDDLDLIEQAGQRAVRLTQRLLAFSRRDRIDPRPCDPGVILDEMCPMLERLLRADVELVVRRDQALGMIHADPVQVEQIILNLVVNAVDAMPGGGRLEILMDRYRLGARAGRRGRPALLRLRVRDDGVGMDENLQARIFEPYFTTKPVGEGTGLGLATVHGIVQQLQGLIGVTSVPGRGTTFEILIPFLGSAELPTLTPESGPGDHPLVLVCESASQLRALICRLLELSGFRSVEAISLAQAEEVLDQLGEAPEVVVLDLDRAAPGDRPGLASFMARHPEARVLVLRAGAGHDPGDEDLERLDVLVKPFDLQALVAAIERLL
ncbi:MAG: hypothetical protein H6807_09125 [Planctomycetes bacterium]|nr:hypothetical protein [Planctomycetota bacterium]